jgi:hypothetical protein
MSAAGYPVCEGQWRGGALLVGKCADVYATSQQRMVRAY